MTVGILDSKTKQIRVLNKFRPQNDRGTQFLMGPESGHDNLSDAATDSLLFSQ
jgi:hypothetical protein